MAVWMLLSAPVHSIVMSGWAPSRPAAVLASCWGSSPLFTVSWKSAPNSLAIVRRSADKSENRRRAGLNTKARAAQKMAPKSISYVISVLVCYTMHTLPVMTTWEAPIALATSRDTKPIGPVEIYKILAVNGAWLTYSCNYKVQTLHKENHCCCNKVCLVFTLNLFSCCHKIQLTGSTVSLTCFQHEKLVKYKTFYKVR